MNDTKNKKKTIEWERLEISLRKLEILREYIMQNGLNKGRKGTDLTETEDIKKR